MEALTALIIVNILSWRNALAFLWRSIKRYLH